MLRRVRIRGYKSLRDVEVRFDRPLSIIIGANASGKSNLFDALALLQHMVTTPTLSDAFQLHRGTPFEAFSYGNEGVEGLLKQRFAEFSIEVDVQLSSSTFEWLAQPGKANTFKQNIGYLVRYGLTVQIDTAQGSLRILSERIVPLNADFAEKTEEELLIERTDDSIKVTFEGASSPSIYNSSPDSTLFTSILKTLNARGDFPIPPNLLTPIFTIPAETLRWHFYDLDPKLMRKPIELRRATTLQDSGYNLAAFFNTMAVEQPKQFESIQRALRLLIPQLEVFDVDRSSDGFLSLNVREGGVKYSSRIISDGTLRVLALLAATNPLEPATLLGIEEPENGVHPRRLQLIASLLRNTAQEKGTQVLVNTHSPLLPRYFPEDDLIVCRRIDGETVFEHLDTSSREPADIEQHLNDEEPTSITDRIVRGDYGG